MGICGGRGAGSRLVREAELVAAGGGLGRGGGVGSGGAALARRGGRCGWSFRRRLAAVGLLPWELARVDGRVLAAHRVSVIVDQQPRYELEKVPVGDRLRMLAVFCLPEGAGALNLRKERSSWPGWCNRLAKVNSKAIELRVLQYGATRQRLEDVLLEAEGWDVVHLSGHGLPAGWCWRPRPAAGT